MNAATRVIAVFVGVVLIIYALVRFALPRLIATGGPPSESPAVVATPLPPLAGLTWIAGGPLTADSLRGRLTVLALWSATDPECLRELPRFQAWHQAYGRYGVRIVGVHEPEFAFAADSGVPAAAARRLAVEFPVALDPDYRLQGLMGEAGQGPCVVIADTAGIILRAEPSRGRLAGLEAALREQIGRLHPELKFPADAGAAAGPSARPGEPVAGAHVVHLGVARVRDGPIVGTEPGRAVPFTAQFRFQVEGKPYVPYPVGLWTPAAEGLVAERGGAENYVALRYDAGSLWAVLSPPAGGSVRVWVLQDEKWPAAEALGGDARRDGRGAAYVDVSEPRPYEVCRAVPGEHVVKLSPESPGVVFHALIVEPAPRASGER